MTAIFRPNLYDTGLAGQVQDFVCRMEDLYPGIDLWWRHKVLPDLIAGGRLCHVAVEGGTVVGVSISKPRWPVAKFCTLRVEESHRGRGIGVDLIRSTLRDLGVLTSGCKSVRFTMAEEISARYVGLFDRYGFKRIARCGDRYRKGHDEMVFESAAADIARVIRGRVHP